MPFLPSCPLEIYLELKQAGRGGQERLFPQRGGNRTQALAHNSCSRHQCSHFSPSCISHYTRKTPVISSYGFTLISRAKKLFECKCVCVCVGAFVCMSHADDGSTRCRGIEHVLIKIAHTGPNPRLGNELQLQRMKSNYINCLPVDGPSSFFSCTGTHLQPYIIAFDLCNRQQHTASPHLSGLSRAATGN